MLERILFWRYGKNVAVRQGPWKLVKQGSVGFQLFNLDRDISETTDLALREPEIARRLALELTLLNDQMAPPRWA